MKITLLVPAHNEQDNIRELIKSIIGVMDLDYELLIVDDHSQDATKEYAIELAKENPNITVVENTDNPGFANAIKTGFRHATAEAVVPIMADLCDDLGTIRIMAKKIIEGYDVVCGSRYIKGARRIGGSKLKGFLSSAAGWSLYYILGIPTHDIANAFKMYRRKIIERMDFNSKSFDISMEITLKAYYSGFRITEVPTTWHERKKGKSSFKIFKLLPAYLKLYFWAVIRRLGLKNA